MKKIITIMALICAVAFQANAQSTNVEKLLKSAEAKAKTADKHKKDGKLQLQAAQAFLNDDLGDKVNPDRALIYANRALEIAQKNISLKDTLMGLTYSTLGTIHYLKQDNAKALDCFEKAIDGYEIELGRDDPVTNGTKLVYSYLMMSVEPLRGFPKVMEAFYDNNTAPNDKRIQNMDDANIALEMSLELFLYNADRVFRYALPQITYEGKKYFILQTSDWSMESPLVGWLQKTFQRPDAEKETFKGNDFILCGDNFQFAVIPYAERDKVDLTFNFNHITSDPRNLELNEDEVRLKFLSPELYNEYLNRYREFTKKKRK